MLSQHRGDLSWSEYELTTHILRNETRSIRSDDINWKSKCRDFVSSIAKTQCTQALNTSCSANEAAEFFVIEKINSEPTSFLRLHWRSARPYALVSVSFYFYVVSLVKLILPSFQACFSDARTIRGRSR